MTGATSIQLRTDKDRGDVCLALGGQYVRLPYTHALALATEVRRVCEFAGRRVSYEWRGGPLFVAVGASEEPDGPCRVLLTLGEQLAQMPISAGWQLYRGLRSAALLCERRAKRERIIGQARIVARSGRRRDGSPHPVAQALARAIVGIPSVRLIAPMEGETCSKN